MKNKKLFGRMNIIDVVVVLVVIAAAVFFAIRYIGVGLPDTEEMYELRYEVTIEAMPKEYWEEISSKFPAQMIYSGGTLDAYIDAARAEPCEVERFESRDPYTPHATYSIIPPPEREFVRVVFECRAMMKLNSPLNEMGSQEIRIGRSHIIKSREVEMIGYITAMNPIG